MIYIYIFFKLYRNRYDEYDPLEFILGEKSMQSNTLSKNEVRTTEAHSMLKQAYSRLSTMYCMINDYYTAEPGLLHPKPINLETLALKWMDPSYEVRNLILKFVKTMSYLLNLF